MTYQQPSKPKRKTPLAVAIGFALISAFLCIGALTINAIVSDRTAGESVAPIVVPEATSAPGAQAHAKAEPPVARSWGDGTWAVVGEIKPGTYVTTAREGGCYWARVKDFDGSLDSIIANGNLDQGAHGRVTVKKTDKGVEFTGGCVWTRA